MDTLFSEERKIVSNLREKIFNERPLSKGEIVDLIEKLADMIDISTMAMNMVDNLVAKDKPNGTNNKLSLQPNR